MRASESDRDEVSEAEPSNGLEALYARHSAQIRRYVLSTFGSGPPEPDDVVQTAFEAFAKLDDPRAIENPYSFLVRIARNYLFDQHRRFKIRRLHSETMREIGQKSDQIDPERVLLSKEQWSVLEKAITKLDENRREVLIMNRIEGISTSRIAEMKGLSITTVKKYLAEALASCELAMLRAGGR
jgi:RNA polymerase sigma factor (sigma-70 family)